MFVFGESAVQGDPEPAFGVTRVLDVLLRARHPDRKIEVINLGITAINSHVVRQIALDARDKQADYWVVYMGNNEVVGPFGAAGVLTPNTPSTFQVRLLLAIKGMRLGQLLTHMLQRLHPPLQRSNAWDGMEMFAAQKIAADDPRRLQVYHNFRENLASILNAGQSAGAKVLLCTVAVNHKDCAPFASLNQKALSENDLKQWGALIESGDGCFTNREWAKAMTFYQKALAMDDHHAETHFRIAQCHQAQGAFDQARVSYHTACQWDALQFRADATINQTIRDVAVEKAFDSLKLVDVEEVVSRASVGGVAGDELFYEHVHFNFDGNYLVARTMAQAIESSGFPAGSPDCWLSHQACAAALGFTTWNRFAVLDQVRHRLRKPPFTFQMNRDAREKRIGEALAELKPLVKTSLLGTYLKEVDTALEQQPQDWMLLANRATMLEKLDRPQEAIAAWRNVLELAPQSLRGLCRLGNLLGEAGQNEQALVLFDRALAIRPELVEALLGKALVLVGARDYTHAEQTIQQALAMQPGSSDALKLMALICQETGRKDEAIQHYRRVLELRPDSINARISLVKLLSESGRLEEALAECDVAVKTHPSHPEAHVNRALVLQQMKRTVQARQELEEALRLSPQHRGARETLMTLSRSGGTAN